MSARSHPIRSDKGDIFGFRVPGFGRKCDLSAAESSLPSPATATATTPVADELELVH